MKIIIAKHRSLNSFGVTPEQIVKASMRPNLCIGQKTAMNNLVVDLVNFPKGTIFDLATQTYMHSCPCYCGGCEPKQFGQYFIKLFRALGLENPEKVEI